ncbi:MAG: right-handed parallel beta-helix repeat-containing protein, partial [Promethearchaeota archaeon]
MIINNKKINKLKIKKLFTFLLILFPLFTFGFITLNHNSNPSSEKNHEIKISYTLISQNIASDTTWDKANSPYIVSANIDINENVKLTINPGVEILFNGLYSINIKGALNATGTSENPIIFSSNLTNPSSSDWGHLNFENSDNQDSILKYCEISYSDQGIRLIDDFPLISDCVFYNNTNAVYVDIWDVPISQPFSSISNNTFYNNTYAIYNHIDWHTMNADMNYTIINNDIFDNQYALYFEKIDDLESLTIEENHIFRNNYGIYFNRIEDIKKDADHSDEGVLKIASNRIYNNSDSGLYFYMYVHGIIANLSIFDNQIFNNSKHGILFSGEVFDISTLNFYGNKIYQNLQSGVYLTNWGNHLELHDNEIYNNNDYDFECLWTSPSNSINASYNWWGKYQSEDIDEIIFDYYDNSNYAKVIYQPYRIYPIIEFDISNEFLNTTMPLSTDEVLEINCSVLNTSSIQWIYLSENSTGKFQNQSMNFGSKNEWSYHLDISTLERGDTFSFLFYAKDSIGNLGINDNSGLNYTIKIGDYIPPESNINYQSCDSPNVVSNITLITLNAEDIGERTTGIFNISYKIDNGDWNEYSEPFTLSGYSHGNHTISYYATDNAGNKETTHQEEIFLDLQSPDITFQISEIYLSPETPSYNDTSLQINCTVVDDASISWVYLNENSTGTFLNHSMSHLNGNYNFNLDISSLSWGDSIVFSFYANDTTGNIKWKNNEGANYTLQIQDIFGPNTNLTVQIVDLPNFISNSTQIFLNASDLHEQASGIYNITYQIDAGDWNLYSEPFTLSGYSHGNHTISYYATDNAGNSESIKSIELFLDIQKPQLTINFPLNDMVFNESAPYYEVEINDESIESMWYTFLNSSTQYPLETFGIINQTAWDLKLDGNVTFCFYANDSVGHLSLTQITVIKDSKIPELTILTPYSEDLFGVNPPEYSVEINDPHLAYMWYSFDDGINKVFFENNDTFDPSEWEKYPDIVNITFFANDT